jgi:hypothetical protein
LSQSDAATAAAAAAVWWLADVKKQMSLEELERQK